MPTPRDTHLNPSQTVPLTEDQVFKYMTYRGRAFSFQPPESEGTPSSHTPDLKHHELGNGSWFKSFFIGFVTIRLPFSRSLFWGFALQHNGNSGFLAMDCESLPRLSPANTSFPYWEDASHSNACITANVKSGARDFELDVLERKRRR